MAGRDDRFAKHASVIVSLTRSSRCCSVTLIHTGRAAGGIRF